MKVALDRSGFGFWFLYCAVHFSLLMVIMFVFRWLWSQITDQPYHLELAEMAFESLCYAVVITVAKCIQYYIGRKRYKQNPVDRRKNNFLRE